MTLLLTHPDADLHETPPGHPEQVARLPAVRAALAEMDLLRETPEEAPDEVLLRGHPQAYLDALEAAAPSEGWVQIDADTYMSPGSLRAARLAVGAATRAVDAVMTGAAGNAFVAMRPPGHHAETAKSMGFCLFGTVALAARHAMEVHGLTRVGILDFDVHHGNGTQDLLWDEARTLFVSTHQSPLWPGTGAAEERGAHDNVINVPLPPGSDGAAFRAAIAPALDRLDAFAPELVLVSAGFDAHRDDPLAELEWEVEDFAWITERLCDLADRHAGGRLVSCLEGGYDLDALAASTAIHVDVLRRRKS
ncbi:Histone deacetylase-like amidohydrolase [Jannaschia seosinensis]|uniref:Histone deacetylase-like amidohydrolase n=1 Tax=Jannaschia seosinensis TaxID=313367 RepID=A0A0M7BEB0_9RHOB|nr:histone deacetylase family protein [Jannaschia seosinensis]CUH40731.1 Histone deacetylase-like amidohydrolase [Jannaschia seosinensis]